MFLSFVIPVYNTESYLDECLQSLLNQDISENDYELICINDGSTDGSLSILQRYEQFHPNLTVIDQKNGGVCRARNAGLSAAKGDYIWFFDSDDVIRQNSLSLLLRKAQEGCFDRIIIGQTCFIDTCSPSGSTERIFQDTPPWFDSVVSRSLLRREFLIKHDLFFHYPQLRYGEDAMMVYEIKRHFPNTVHIDDVLYFYRIRPNSAVTASDRTGNLHQLTSNIAEAEILRKYYEQKDGILPIETANRFMSFLWCSLFRILMMPGKEAKPYLTGLKQKGLYPYRKPKECTLQKCPEISRNDLMGKLIDLLYTNLSSRWGFNGMRLIQYLFRLKHRIVSITHKNTEN